MKIDLTEARVQVRTNRYEQQITQGLGSCLSLEKSSTSQIYVSEILQEWKPY